MAEFYLTKTPEKQALNVFCIFKDDIKKYKNLPKFFGGELFDNAFVESKNKLFLFYGLGEKKEIEDYFSYFKLFSSLSKFINSKKIEKINLYLGDEIFNVKNFKKENLFSKILKGINNGAYEFDRYLNKKIKKLKKVNLVVKRDTDFYKFKNILDEVKIVLKWINFSKDLINEQSSKLTPQKFKNQIEKIAKELNFKIKIFDKKKLEKLGFGGILGVGKGSDHQPYLIILENLENKNEKPIAFIGKTVTYDTGGVSLKPQEGLVDMKIDMAGGAITACFGFLAKQKNIKKNFVLLLPVVENMIGPHSIKPGDILKIYGGKTVEVINTDAEGRIILADAVSYAKNYNPKAVVTTATLTGACIVALGYWTAGFFTKDKNLKETIEQAGKVSGDRVWQLPIFNEHREQNKSIIADIKNIGGRWAGAITGASFVEFFCDKNIPFLHIDVAGPVYFNFDIAWQKQGATGYGVELLYEFLKII